MDDGRRARHTIASLVATQCIALAMQNKRDVKLSAPELSGEAQCEAANVSTTLLGVTLKFRAEKIS
jgi:hypothetical protein